MENLSGNVPKICFFDSGIGGLNLLYESVRKIANAQFYYFADNFNVPYGGLSQKEIIEKTDSIFFEINRLNPAAAVIACNTVTAQCAGYLRAKYSFPIIGIQPAVKPAAANGRCVVLATPVTAQSDAVKELVERFGNGRTQIVACPDLAAYVEGNIFDLKNSELAAHLPKMDTDGVVLGCTHYIFIKEYIEKFYGCPVYDGVEGTVNRLCSVLGNFAHIDDTQGKFIPKNDQSVVFVGGDTVKNGQVFNLLKGNLSLKNTPNKSSGKFFPKNS